MSRTKDATLSTPPGTTKVGDAYIVNLSATDEWAGKERVIAVAADEVGTEWSFRPAQTGDRFFDETSGKEWVYDGTNWLGIIAPFSTRAQKRATTATYVGVESQPEGLNFLAQPLTTSRKLLITHATVGLAVSVAGNGQPRYSVGGSGTNFGGELAFDTGDQNKQWHGSILSPLAAIAGAATPASLAFGWTFDGTLNSDYQNVYVEGWLVDIM